MPNRQPPNDPNLERDLWGDDDRPMIDLQRKQRDDRAEVSNWEDEGETSNWDDADDYDREYDEPGYGAGLTTPTDDRDVEANEPEGSGSPEFSEGRYSASAVSAGATPNQVNIGDPDLLDANEAEAIGGDRTAQALDNANNAPGEPDGVAASSVPAQDTASETEIAYQPPSVTEAPTEAPTNPAIADQSSNRDPVHSDDQGNDSPESGDDRSASAIASYDSSDPSPAAFDQTTEGSITESEDDEPIYQADDAVAETSSPTPSPIPLDEDGAIAANRQETSSDPMGVNELEAQARTLRQEIAQLQAQKSQLQIDLSRLIQESLQDLKVRRQELQTSVDKLERRQARIQEEMQTTFAGASQDLAVRVQGFKEYLVGSLQDLSLAAERLKLTPEDSPRPRIAPRDPVEPARSPRPAPQDPNRDRRNPPLGQPSFQTSRPPRPDLADRQPPIRSDRPIDRPNERPIDRPNDRPNERPIERPIDRPSDRTNDPSFGKKGFQDQASFIRSTLDRYRDRPDYYGPPWQLRRTFQPVQAERVSDWFFNQSGRGVVRSMGSRLQNILIASTTISILRGIYDKRLRTLVLANSPERLGEWRRGLQDCLGITRNDFGPDRGITLFEDPMLMAQKAERLVKAGWLPLIVMDESEAQLNLSLLQFPLWLAFAADPSRSQSFDRDWLVR